MTNMDKYLSQIERAITVSYMHVVTQFPAVKKAENRLVQSYIDVLTKKREKQWQERALPGFIVIGGMKCGTSSLFKYLNQHPQLFSSNYKEIRYFSHDEYYSKGEKWYRSQFPIIKKNPNDSLTFEASPNYLFSSKSPKRMANLIPNVKLIALLRNPTERAISHYFHDIKKGRIKRDILDAMKIEGTLYRPVGMYKEQLERYYNLFDSDKILVISSESFFEDPVKTLKDIYLFLDVDPNIEIRNLSPKQVGVNREPVNAAVYDYLNDYFDMPNQELFEYIGKEFNW